MNSKSQNRRVPQVSGKRELHYIYKEYKGLEQGGRKVRYLLFPLSFGRRQEEIIRAGLVNPGIFKTARLSKKGSDYFLAINIATEEPEKIETGSFMGVARGLSSPMNYTITDLTGNACGNGSINLPGTSGYTRNSLRIGDLHRIANEITAKALEYKACVIAEKLVDKGDRLQWADGSGKEFFPVLGCSDYNRILRLLQYKLPAKGLPIPVRVSPSRIFSSCHVCGENSKQNRFNRDLFICTACGNTEHMEGLGSLNLSRRLLQNSSIPVIIRAERTSCGIRFTNKELGLECSIPLQKDLPQAMSEELDKLIRDFFSSLGSESKGSGFNKKYSLIKKLQQCKDKMQLIKLIG